MSYKNGRDRSGRCFFQGKNAEDELAALARKRGISVRKATRKEETVDHFDFEFTKDDSKHLIEVKSRKRICRSAEDAQDEWVWIEFKNVRGDDGWIVGNANFIAFEREKDFVFVPRKKLLAHCEEIVDFKTMVTVNKLAKYKIYSRADRPNERLTMVRFSDILSLPHFLWEKQDNLQTT